MRNVISLFALAALVTLFSSGCAGPEKKLGRGISNTFEITRMGDMRRSVEQTAVFESPSAGYTVGAVHGLTRTVARTFSPQADTAAISPAITMSRIPSLYPPAAKIKA